MFGNVQGCSGMFQFRILSTAACNYQIFLSRHFHRPIYFKFQFTANSDPRKNLSDQSQAWTWLFDWRHYFTGGLKRKRKFFVTDARSCRPELTRFAGEKSLKIGRSVKMPWHRLSFRLSYTGHPRSHRNLHKLGTVLLKSNAINDCCKVYVVSFNIQTP